MFAFHARKSEFKPGRHLSIFQLMLSRISLSLSQPHKRVKSTMVCVVRRPAPGHSGGLSLLLFYFKVFHIHFLRHVTSMRATLQ